MWVSRRHCSIEDRHGVPVVRDLGSTHGTWVNDQRVKEAEIHPGDRLSIGLTTLTAAPDRWWWVHRVDLPALFAGHILVGLLGLAICYYVMYYL
jgi:hypothetical protein